MKDIIIKDTFKKNWKALQKKHYSEQKLQKMIELLSSGNALPNKFHDHALAGNLKGFRECHIEADWLLIYYITEEAIILVATGTHDSLFK